MFRRCNYLFAIAIILLRLMPITWLFAPLLVFMVFLVTMWIAFFVKNFFRLLYTLLTSNTLLTLFFLYFSFFFRMLFDFFTFFMILIVLLILFIIDYLLLLFNWFVWVCIFGISNSKFVPSIIQFSQSSLLSVTSI